MTRTFNKQKLIQIAVFFLFFFCLALVLTFKTHAATLSLSPASSNVKAGEDLVVKVILDAQAGQLIDGADAVLKYDANKLKTKGVKAGTAFANIVTKERRGKIQISGLASTKGTLFTVPDTMATITFEVLESGVTSLSFDFTQDSTIDSNVVSHKDSKDLLVSVSGGQYSVQATSRNQFLSVFRRLLPIFFIIFIFLIVAAGVIWYLRSRKRGGGGEDVFYPEPVPMDQEPENTGYVDEVPEITNETPVLAENPNGSATIEVPPAAGNPPHVQPPMEGS